jgi:hypothetical protein
MKKIRGDKPIGVIIHTYIHGNITRKLPVYYLYLKLKCHVFLFYLFPFFSFKIRQQEDRTSLAQGEGWHQWEGGGVEERSENEYGAIKCVHMQENVKMIPVETTPGIGGGGIKENG